MRVLSYENVNKIVSESHEEVVVGGCKNLTPIYSNIAR